jgi:uncharacterized protein HemX
MSALQQLSSTSRPSTSQPLKRPAEVQRSRTTPRTTPQQRVSQRQKQHRIMATEVSLKLVMNVMIASVALVTLGNIIPTRTAQHEKLREVQTEVALTENRVQQLQTEFNRTFDASQERQIAQEQTHFVDPNRTPLVWLDKKGRATAQLPE